MPDFVIKERDYNNVADLLSHRVPGFSESEPYRRLSAEEQKLPGLVVAAFTRYFEQTVAPPGAGASDSLESCYAVIEELASSPDPEVKNLVVTEIFENLRASESTLRRIKQQLGPESRRLYEHWVE